MGASFAIPPIRRWQMAALAALFAALFVSRIIQITDHDVFLHARGGWWILEHRAIPRTDPFSLLGQGERWIDHQWLAQILTALGSARPIGGFVALGLIRAALLTLSYLVAFGAMREPGASFWPAAIVLSLGSMAAWRYSEPRPYVITYLAMAWMAWASAAWLKRRSKAYYALPAVMLIWANCHAGFLSGIAWAGALAVGETLASVGRLRASASGPRASGSSVLAGAFREAKPLWITLAAAIAASCVNPYGPAALFFPLKVMGVNLFEMGIFEWNSPALEYDFWPYYLYVALLAAAFAARPRSIGAADWIASAGFLWLAWSSRRHIPLLAYATMPILAEQLEAWRLSAPPRRVLHLAGRHFPAPRWREIAVAALLIGEGLWARRILVLDYIPFGLGLNPLAQPAKALDFIEASGLEPNLFHSYNWGGFIAWRMKPPWRDFVDGRVDLYGPARVEEYFQWISGKGDWQSAFNHYEIRTVLLDYQQAQGKLGEALWRASDWALVYWDDVAVIYARRGQGAGRVIAKNECRFINPAWSYAQMADANPPGQKRQAAMAELDRRLQADPRSIRALDFRSFFLSIEGRLDEAAALCRQMIEIEPRAGSAQFRLGSILEKAGDPNGAERAYRAALRFKPGLAEAWVRLGAISEKKGGLKPALRRYERALKARPGDADALYNCARVLARLGRDQESIRRWEEYFSVRRPTVQQLIDVAWLYEHVGAAADAWRLLEQALARGEQREKTQLAIAGLFARTGLADEAAERLLAAAREFGPSVLDEAQKSGDFPSILADPAWRSRLDSAAQQAKTSP